MAETVKIEIPITAKDNTAAGIKAAEQKLTAFERKYQQMETKLNRIGGSRDIEVNLDDNASSGLGAISDRAEALSGRSANVSVSVANSASDVISEIADQVEALGGMSGSADIGANDTASSVISAAGDAVENFDGMSGSADIGVSDNATQTVRAASDAVENFSGSSGSADIGVSDNATQTVRAAEDAVENFDGMSATADIGVSDNASQVIDSVIDKLSQLDGISANPSIGVGGVTGQAQEAASSLVAPITTAAGGVGAGLFVGGSLNTYGGFEAQMSQVQAISGASQEEMDALTEKAKQMGATTKFTATEAGEAFNYMAMAGWKTDSMLGGIEGIMNLAAASGESLATTSDIVTDALTAFGLTSEKSGHFADVLAAASSNANTNVSMMGESFKYVAPVAGAMNYSVEDTSLALGLMANASIKGSMAGTALKTAIANMAAPTDTMAAAMEEYGISLTDNEGNMKSLYEVMQNLRSSLGGLSEQEQTAAASAIFGKEAMSGMLAIINASDSDFTKLTKAVNSADGAAQQMATTMMDNMQGSLTLMSSAVDGVKNSFGERLAPYITAIATDITEAMPGIDLALQNMMDTVDTKIDQLKEKITTMTLSEEWQNADLFGKIDIAWDTIIAEPLSTWVQSTGIHTVSGLFQTLFESAIKILPGGEEAGITSWISAAILGITGFKAVSGVASLLTPIATGIVNIVDAAKGASSISEFTGNLSGMMTAAQKGSLIAIGIAAAAAAITALYLAIDAYNERQIQNNLKEAFGDIELTAKEIREAAGQILDAKYMVNIEVAMDAYEVAEKARQEAQDALNANNKLTWIASISGGTITVDGKLGVKMDENTQTQFKTNIESYIKAKITELENETYPAYVAVQTFLGNKSISEDPNGPSLASQIQEWAMEDQIEMTALGNELTRAVEDALRDGVMDVDEMAVVTELQNKMNTITSRWHQSEAMANMSMIRNEFGQLSAAELTSGSYTTLIQEMQDQMNYNHASAMDVYKSMMSNAGSALLSGRITQSEYDSWDSQAWAAMAGQELQEGKTIIDVINGTLSDTYGERISKNNNDAQSRMASNLQGLLRNYNNYMEGDGYAWSLFVDSLNDMAYGGANSGSGSILDPQQEAIARLWQSEKSIVDQYGTLIDEYAKSGEAVPKQIMEAYNEAMMNGAASGDSQAAAQLWANEIVQWAKENYEEGGREILDQINMMADNGLIQDGDFATAWRRALMDVTDEEVEIEGLEFNVDLTNPSVSVKDENLRKGIEAALDKVGIGSKDIAIRDDGKVKIILENVNVEEEETQKAIEEALGVSIEQMEFHQEYDANGDITLGTVTVSADDIDLTALEEMTGAVIEETDMAAGATDGLTESVHELSEAFYEAAAAASESFSGMFGLFDTAQANMDATVEAAQNALTSQLKYWTEYGSNLEVIRNYKPEEGSALEGYDMSALFSMVSDGSADSAGLAASIADAIIQGDDQVLATLLDTFMQVAEARTNAAMESAAGQVNEEVPIDLSGMILHGDLESAEMIFDNATIGQKVQAALEAADISAETYELASGGIMVELGDVDINDASVQQQIADALGTTVESLTFSPATVDMPATVTIPEEDISVDFKDLYAAIVLAAEAAENVETPEVTASANATVDAASTDASGAYTDMTTQTQETFDTEFPTDGSTDVTVSQTNNADDVYSEVASDLQTAFDTTIDAYASVNVHVSWYMTNGTNSASVSSSNFGNNAIFSASLAHSAVGRYVDGFMVSTLGEDGPEYVIPVGPGYRDRGLDLWAAAGQDLGVPGFAEGGAIGTDSIWSTLGTGTADDEDDNEPIAFSVSTSQNAQDGSGTPVTVNVSMNPTITIEGGGTDPEAIYEAIVDRIEDIADVLGEEIAEKLGQIYQNRPVVKEA